MICPICEGKGGWTDVIDCWLGGPYEPCYVCNEKGSIGIWKWMSIWFWEHIPIGFVEWYGDWRARRSDAQERIVDTNKCSNREGR